MREKETNTNVLHRTKVQKILESYDWPDVSFNMIIKTVIAQKK